MSPTEAKLERELEELFRTRVRLMGGYTIKLAPTERGVPDRLVVAPGGRMYLVELKTDTGVLSPIQRHWHERMASRGVRVVVLYGESGVLDFVRELVDRTPTRRPSRAAELTEKETHD